MTRKLDELVARALGLNVAGWYNANEDPEIPGWWHFSRDGKKRQLAYVENCMCGLYNAGDDGWWADLKPLPCGHLYMCLRAVPFYSEDLNEADKLIDSITNGSAWECYLCHQFRGWECYFKNPGIAYDANGKGDTMAVAICRAFVLLKREEGRR